MKVVLTLMLCMALTGVFAQHKNYDKIVRPFVEKENFNGTVLVASNGKIEFEKSYGLADRQLHIPLSNSNRYKICSITKTFTTILLLQLYEAGKLKFTDKIGDYLKDYTGEAKDKVTIHHLLTYSSGIPNCEHGKGMEVYQLPVSVDSFITKYCSDSLEFSPGSRFSYDNGAFILLGKIIEQITGKSYAQNLQESILKPLKMNETGLLDDRKIVENLVPSYVFDTDKKEFQNDIPFYIENYGASGAMYSTVEDLLKFDQAIFTDKIISKSTRDLMLTAYPELYNVAYGFWVSDMTFGKVKTVGADRQGSIWGSNTTWLHLIPENKVVIIFSNTNATDINSLREALVNELLK